MNYDHLAVEKKWQDFWSKEKTFKAEINKEKEKYYALDMFPYPSGAGLHVGHPVGYTATDIMCRYKRHTGFNVLHPMGWDAFGLPAENFAIKTGVHPEVSTKENINNFRRQIQALGFSYDWSREFSTTDPDYFKWSQWIFLQLYHKGLAYEEEKSMYWCPHCQVVCANEEVEQGNHERCGNLVERKQLKQWMFRITDYAERLLSDLENPTVYFVHGWEETSKSYFGPWLKETLETLGYTFVGLDMPNTKNPNYEDWKKAFEPHEKNVNSNSILIGHSLGATFWLKYLSEKSVDFEKLILVAPPTTNCVDVLKPWFADNGLNTPYALDTYGSKIQYFYSDNDPWNTKQQFENFAETLSVSKTLLKNRGHFKGQKFPELIWAVTHKENGGRFPEGCCSDGNPCPLNFKNILWQNLVQVKQASQSNFKLASIKAAVETSFGTVHFCGKSLLQHFYSKPKGEQRYRISFAKTVLKALPYLVFESETVGYFVSKQKVFRVILEKDTTNVFQVKTYYEVEKLQPLYQKWLADLNQFKAPDFLEWPEKIKVMQANWIGKSEGAEVKFGLNGYDLWIYTTRPDTLFGCTYMVLSPEHPLVAKITTNEQKHDVEAYISATNAKSDLQRTDLNKDKTGVFTGAYAVNPVNNEKVPVWIADYVLMSYGTGAIMAVPAHDERDHEFAEKYLLEIKDVVASPTLRMDTPEEGKELPGQELIWGNDKKAYFKISNYFSRDGILYNSGFLNGLPVEQAIPKIINYLEANKLGKKQINYRLRDWIFTRQRYWGEPIPVVFDAKGTAYPLDESELPLTLPQTPNYAPLADGSSPLANLRDWVEVKGYVTENGTVKTDIENATSEVQAFERETSTMPNWAGSSWYWLRFMDSNNDQEFCSKEAENYWGPVDLYVGGAEHAVLHLLYARFWHKVLFDLGLVSTKEPFRKLVNQGLIMGEDGQKMSKSLGNVINPDDVINEFGADTLRCYEMFMGPFDQNKNWSTSSLAGMKRFLDRVWRLTEKVSDSAHDLTGKDLAQLHKTIKLVGDHIEQFKFNTAVSGLMELTNTLTGVESLNKETLSVVARLISPFAPHLAEEMWLALFDGTDSIAYQPWPFYDASLMVDDTVTYAVQVNGKVRADFEISKEADKDTVLAEARALENVAKYLEGVEIRKEIFVPGKIVGFVT